MEKDFLNIAHLSKSFGEGDMRTEVLHDLNFRWPGGNFACCLDRRVPANRRCSM